VAGVRIPRSCQPASPGPPAAAHQPGRYPAGVADDGRGGIRTIDRHVADLDPEIAPRALAAAASREYSEADSQRVERMLGYLARLVDLDGRRRVLLAGCGPVPTPVKLLAARGFEVTGLDVEPSFVAAARAFVGDAGDIIEASAEAIPLADGSQDLVWCDSLLEHVESPRRTLAELYRVIAPGGVALIVTTNRQAISITGRTGEFNVPFFSLLPAIVRESYIFEHYHRRPELANFTARPAVHWFTFASLCRLGRDAGFARFYGLVDLLRPTDPVVQRSRFRGLVLRLVQRSPWARALVLTQTGGTILMVKRSATE